MRENMTFLTNYYQIIESTEIKIAAIEAEQSIALNNPKLHFDIHYLFCILSNAIQTLTLMDQFTYKSKLF